VEAAEIATLLNQRHTAMFQAKHVFEDGPPSTAPRPPPR
jgi:hypothetical protein